MMELLTLSPQITIPFRSVRAITKEKTALVIPNAIQISVSSEKYGFSSLVSRDVAFNIIFKCWQNNLLDQVRMSTRGARNDKSGKVNLECFSAKPHTS